MVAQLSEATELDTVGRELIPCRTNGILSLYHTWSISDSWRLLLWYSNSCLGSKDGHYVKLNSKCQWILSTSSCHVLYIRRGNNTWAISANIKLRV